MTERCLYTGPLTVAADLGTVGGPRDAGEHAIILMGLALNATTMSATLLHVRMEMTPEEARDLAVDLWGMAERAMEQA